MVVGAHHSCYAITWSSAYFWWQLCRCSIYLFFVLMKWKSKHRSLLVIVVGFLLFYLAFRKEWMLIPVGLCFIGFFISHLGDYIHIAWMQLAKLLGYINSRILLLLVFFTVLTPIAFLRKFFGKKNDADKNSLNSYFQNRNQVFQALDLRNPW